MELDKTGYSLRTLQLPALLVHNRDQDVNNTSSYEAVPSNVWKSGSSGRRRPGPGVPYTGLLALAVLISTDHAIAFEPTTVGPVKAHATLNTRVGLRYGTGLNYGLGAFDAIGETERTALYLVAKPKLDLAWARDASEFYGAVSVVAATTTLDGELSGQFARSGDEVLDTDHAYVGWRNDIFDFSVGGQEFWVGDGWFIGDGNFNQGGEDGQYWTGAFSAWRNTAIMKVNTEPVRGEVFWLRSDNDFRDGRVVGINIETTTADTFGTLGFMYAEIIAGGAFHLNGINAWNVRGAQIKVPGIPNLELYGEFIRQVGTDVQGGGVDNEATGWYIEGDYALQNTPWAPVVAYRYARMSGDELNTPENEEYRGAYFTIFKRDWDTWYMGEIAGEMHLFNENQITQMVKIKAYPVPNWSLTFYYYHHELEEPQYFGAPVSSTDWSDELNFGVEYFPSEHFFGYAGIAWSTPGDAPKELWGDDDITVIQTFLSYTF